ncbi:MAG: hypothetical protein HQL88_03805 [Magnetococcales bacterium]|nr:hypothetical protein [Magnetococcales bacterium]
MMPHCAGCWPAILMAPGTLSACNWRREQAAHYLGMSRTTLFRKMRQLGIALNDVLPLTRGHPPLDSRRGE